MNTNFELCFIRHAPKRNLFSNYELHWPCTLNNENKWQQIPTLWQPHYLSATREDRAVSHSHRQNSLEMSPQPYSCQFILYQHQKQLEKTNMKVLMYQQHPKLRDHALKMLLLAFQKGKSWHNHPQSRLENNWNCAFFLHVAELWRIPCSPCLEMQWQWKQSSS